MTERNNSATKKSLAGWTLQISLVLVLAMFSAPGPALRSFAPTLSKTELAESRSSYSKGAVCFNKVCNKHGDSLQQALNLTSLFISSLWQYDNTLRVKFKVNFKVLAIVKDWKKSFSSNKYPRDSRDLSDGNNSRG